MNEYDIDIKEFLGRKTDRDLILDIREKADFERENIEGSVNMPLSEISRLYELPKDKTVYVICYIGESSPEIAELLRDAGYDAFSLQGGYRQHMRYLLEDIMK